MVTAQCRKDCLNRASEWVRESEREREKSLLFVFFINERKNKTSKKETAKRNSKNKAKTPNKTRASQHAMFTWIREEEDTFASLFVVDSYTKRKNSPETNSGFSASPPTQLGCRKDWKVAYIKKKYIKNCKNRVPSLAEHIILLLPPPPHPLVIFIDVSGAKT